MALVVHVDLSVLVWFVAFAGLLWSLNGSPRGLAWGWAALGLCGAGAALMSLSAFVGQGAPIMANYIPVLERTPFMAGLLAFATGATVLVLRGLFVAPKVGLSFDGEGVLRFGLNASVVSAAVALLAFGWSYLAVPATLVGKMYYEVLFWGGGHALQFTWTLLMLVAWLWLAQRLRRTPAPEPASHVADVRAGVGRRVRDALRLPGASRHLGRASQPAYLGNATGWRHRDCAYRARRAVGAARRCGGNPADTRALRAALIWSMVLFAAGGLIGAFINGADVRIPAHYHGCIVGVTLALMGLAYHLLPQLGYAAPHSRLAALQPALYGTGQLMHITGLVWSGGYGVQRKVAGAEQVLRTGGEIAGMGLMGLGGLVAIAGGLLFVVLMVGAARQGRG